MGDAPESSESSRPGINSVAWGVVALGAFVLAVRLLGAATGELAPTIERMLAGVAGTDLSTLGVAWLAAYLIGNGSVVAAVAVSLFQSSLLTTAQLFVAIAGSRLGAAGIVVLVGVLDATQHAGRSVTKSVGLGLLAFVLTIAVYVPSTLMGYVLLPTLDAHFSVPAGMDGSVASPGLVGSMTDAVLALVGPVLAVVLAIGLLFFALWLLDRLLDRIDTDWIRSQTGRWLATPWRSFAVGFILTTLATSVAFSIGIVVPLYNRRYVERAEIVPFVMAANLATLSDTAIVAIVLEAGVGVVLLTLAMGAAVTMAYLLVYRTFYGLIGTVMDGLLARPRSLAAVFVVLALIPVALVLVA